MEHVTIREEGGRQVHLTAEPGYRLRSKKTGREYGEISTLDLKRWEVVIDEAPAEKPKKGKGKK